jgi:hypothetical protein
MLTSTSRFTRMISAYPTLAAAPNLCWVDNEERVVLRAGSSARALVLVLPEAYGLHAITRGACGGAGLRGPRVMQE